MARPRDFDETDVLEAAMNAFWGNGFHGTSLDDLESGTGLNRSSLYNAFGTKADLFCGALDQYSLGPCNQLFRPLDEHRGGTALYLYLEGLKRFVGSPQVRRGCLMVRASLAGVSEPSVQERIDAHFRSLRAGYRRAYTQGLEDGTVSGGLTPSEAADWLLAFVRGVLTGAAAGEDVSALRRSIVATAKQLGVKRP